MGPPPQYLIERKLIRKFMKEYLPKSPLIPEHYFVSVFECWRRYGAGSPRCREQEMQYDFANEESRSYRKKLSQLGYAQIVTSYLKKPVYPFLVKGRHKKTFVTNVLKFF